MRNLMRNSGPSEATAMKAKRKTKAADQSEEVMELDWLTVTSPPLMPPSHPIEQRAVNSRIIAPVYDLIISVDTLYNPSLSAPLACTIAAYANARTIVLVVAELREPEALELWLGEMLARGWSIVRVGDDTHGDARKAWIGWICWMS